MKRMLSAVAVLGLVFAATACGGGDDSASSGATSTASSTSTTRPTSEAAVKVYFAWHEKVGTAGRDVNASAKEKGAVEALLDGPNAFEKSIGMGTEIPAGSALHSLTIADGIATADLSSVFQSGGGSLSMQLRTAELVFTLTQFPAVRSVTIRIDGKTVDAIGGEGVPASDLDRADFTDQTPLILVESPVPGQSVTSPLEVAGISNTFEATVNYSINDPDGLVLVDGSTMASAGTGTWGDFHFVVDFGTPKRDGLGSVITWEVSPKDGSQQNVYEVPVNMH